ncbi:MAG TPA: phosphotransferase [Acidimicrobiales bacterium]|nr:phosphotransferase [Acidimicrobiales bacterium]
MNDELPVELAEWLPHYLGAQRWFSGGEPAAADVRITTSRQLWSDGQQHQMWQLLVDVAGDCYQVVLGMRPAGEVADFLNGHESAVLGTADGVFIYDAVWDPDLAKRLLSVASEGQQSATRSRPMGVEQSNTSLVFDDRLILKLFRHLHAGRNPDIEVTSALAGNGFTHVAGPLVHWRDETYDLAFAQEFLAGGTEGWALALTSLRNFYSSEDVDVPGEAGGDFAAEAERLGRVTAEMHVALSRAFAPAPTEVARSGWAALIGGLPDRLAGAGRHLDRDLLEAARPMLEHLGTVTDPGPFIRVHGDYHLGQVMRTDLGWFVLDFEGEPAKSVDDRIVPASPFKDVTGMLRSFHYASRHALMERAVPDWADMIPTARAWESHNRQAFLDGYLGHADVAALLPDTPASAAVMTAYELDKALYELEYELSYRPDWVAIPLDALERLVEGGGNG